MEPSYQRPPYNALDAAGSALQDSVNCISEDLRKSKYLKADETPYPMRYGRTGYVWAVTGDRSVVVCASPSRSSLVINGIAPYHDKQLTCDGYSAYNEFETRQRCWAHILRESEDLARQHGDKHLELIVLYESLAHLYHDAKLRQRGSGDHPVVDTGPMEATASAIASRYERFPRLPAGDTRLTAKDGGTRNEEQKSRLKMSHAQNDARCWGSSALTLAIGPDAGAELKRMNRKKNDTPARSGITHNDACGVQELL